MTNDLLSGASQIAALMARQSKPGFSTDPADHQPARAKFNGPEFNSADPKYRPDLDPAGNFLIGDVAHEEEHCLVLGSLSGVQEHDRSVNEYGKNVRDLFQIWRTQPKVTPVKGKGGGLKTDRGGWLGDKIDEIFLLTSYGLTVLTLYDQHQVVAALNQRAQSLGVAAMFHIKWAMRKKKATFEEDEYPKYEPNFEVLGVKGQPSGPTDAEIARAERLADLVAQLSHPDPDVPLRLVVGSSGGKLSSSSSPSTSFDDDAPSPDPDDPGPTPPDPDNDIPL
jgi:hypothetical protein